MNAASPNAMPTPLVSTEWLAAHLEDPHLRILDCTVVMLQAPGGGYAFGSGAAEYAKSHIPGAVFCDVTNELKDKSDPRPQMLPKPAEMSEVMSRLGVGKGTKAVIYDRGNHVWAARVWWTLRTYGFDDAAVLDGGWQKWIAEGRPTSDEATSYPRGNFEPHFRPELMASKEQVLAAIGHQGTVLVNALSPAEHKGETKRLPRAGRIRGSVNVHADALLDSASKSYLERAELGRRFADAGVEPVHHVVTYCGGGVSACSDALALTLLGFENVSVYDGSLAEWTADPNAPMETG